MTKRTLAVKIGGIGRQKTGRKISFTVDRKGRLTTEVLDELLTGAHLSITLMDATDVEGQETIKGTKKGLTFPGDCTGFSVKKDHFSFAVVVPLNLITAEAADLWSFVAAKAVIVREGDAASTGAGESDDAMDDALETARD